MIPFEKMDPLKNQIWERFKERGENVAADEFVSMWNEILMLREKVKLLSLMERIEGRDEL